MQITVAVVRSPSIKSLGKLFAHASLIVMRPILIAILFAVSTHAAERPFPQWDGTESIEQYARRANLPPTKTLDLGAGVKLELVLIPAGEFLIGTPKPQPVDVEDYRSKIRTGQVFLGIGAGAFLVLLAIVLFLAIRKWQRPQYSLAWFLVMTLVAGIGLMGGLHWHFSVRALANAKIEYEAATARFEVSSNTVESCCDREKPAHGVTLTKPYYLGKFEVMQEQYQQIMGNNPSHFKGRDLPVEQVSWNEAQEFCRKVSEKVGSTVRLPREAEWERACRAGTRTTYYAGDAEADLDQTAWYGKNSNQTTHPVGGKAPNAWGVYDMHGNAWEWCADWQGAYTADAVLDPQGPTIGEVRVLRGGSWCGEIENCRSADRSEYYPERRDRNIGFRVVMEAPGVR